MIHKINTRSHILSVLFVIFYLLVCFAYQMPPVYAALEENEYTAGVPANFPPQYRVDEKTGKPYGFAIDVMDEVARRSGIKVRYAVYGNFSDVMVAMQKGEIDLIPNVGITDERKKYSDFTAPVETFHIHIFVRTTTSGIENIDDLAGRKVAVVSENQGYFIMTARNNSQLLVYDSMEEALMALISGNADAIVYPEPPLLLVARQSGIEDRIKTAGDALVEIKRSIGVRKGEPELYSKLDETVNTFILTPEYEAIYVKWYGEPGPYWNTERVAILIISLVVVFAIIFIILNYYSVKKINIDLKESKNYIETIIKTSVDGIFVIDGEGKFEFGNEAFYRILGWPQADLIGESFLKVIPPDQHEFIMMRWKEVQERKGKPFETVIVTKDASRRDIFVSHTDVELRGEKKYVVMIKDVTEFKQAEGKLRESEERYRTIVEYSNDMIWTLDTDGNFLFFNKRSEEITGYKLEDWRGKSFAHLIIKEDLPELINIFHKTLEGVPHRYEASFTIKNGKIITIEGNTAPIYSRGEIVGTVTLGRDITERKLAEEKLLKANRLYFVISQINQAIVRVQDKDKILEEACRIAIEYGKFKLAWIGMVDEKTKLVTPAAYSGDEDGYLANINISTEYVPIGRGPTGTAIREGMHNVCDDIEKDPRMAPWKEEAIKRGYRSLISLPIKHLGKVIGAFSIYSSVPHFFDEEEIRLLDEVTSDISFALDSIENTKKKQEAEAELEKHRFHLEEMVNERTAELERMNRLFIGRELKMKELKKRIAELEDKKKEEDI